MATVVVLVGEAFMIARVIRIAHGLRSPHLRWSRVHKLAFWPLTVVLISLYLGNIAVSLKSVIMLTVSLDPTSPVDPY